MDIYFNYPDASTSVLEINKTSTVSDMYWHVEDDQGYGADTFVVISSSNNDCLWSMDTCLSDIILDGHEMHVEALCNDPCCAMSIRHSVLHMEDVCDLRDLMRYTDENHPRCIEYLSANPLDLDIMIYGYCIHEIPISFITQEFCYKAVMYDACLLKDIPDHFKTQTMCENALHRVLSAFKYIPDHFITQDMCNTAFDRNEGVIKYIPERYITEKMRETLVMDIM